MSNIRAAQLVIVNSGMLETHILDKEQFTIGRVGGANDIFINSGIVSSQHGMITYFNGMFVYNDLASTNGTAINGKLVKSENGMPSAPYPLMDGDVLYVGTSHSREKVYMVFSNAGVNYDWSIIPITAYPQISIGRGNGNNIVIPTITVSRQHATIRCENGAVYVNDMGSANGTFLNGTLVKGSTQVPEGGIIRIENTKIIRLGDYIIYSIPKAAKPQDFGSYSMHVQKQKNGYEANPEKYELARQAGVEVVVRNISRMVKCKNGTGINGGAKKYILQNVSLTINPGELVAILGGSGAGKTTFMNCINGFEPATEGTVLINGTELYKNYQSLKAMMGYVPQQDIVHDDLTLESMLTYTGRLRLPKDVTKQEIGQRVAEVLDMVDLTAQKDTYIRKLSGGQRKRASIAVELVSDPTLFFLDEPTSGLDPEAETNLMHQLRGLSETKGKTVIVITHTLQNIHLFDKVIFLAPGGKLCFCGPPDDAKKFFEVDNLADAYEKISADIDGYVNKYNSYAQGGGQV